MYICIGHKSYGTKTKLLINIYKILCMCAHAYILIIVSVCLYKIYNKR